MSLLLALGVKELSGFAACDSNEWLLHVGAVAALSFHDHKDRAD